MPADTATFTSLFAGASLMVAFFGGMVMLFAPCCITLMLPTYLGTVFKARAKVLLMTLVFAAGVASILLPVVLGARFLVSFFNAYHFFVFAGGSLVMIGVGLLALFDKTVPIPFVAKLHAPRVSNAASAYLLGVVSGVSSSCCAPVLLGALALAAVSPTALQAAGVGVAYTLGIVFPLLLVSLFLERGASRWVLKLQRTTLQFGSFRVTLSNFLSFLVFTTTGVVFLILAMTNRIQMGEGVVQLSIALKQWIDAITKPLRALPYGDFLFALLLLLVLLYIVRSAVRSRPTGEAGDGGDR